MVCHGFSPWSVVLLVDALASNGFRFLLLWHSPRLIDSPNC